MGMKNIIFDMGMVLVNYDPDGATRRLTDNGAEIREIHNVLYCSSEWILMDLGVITEEQALARILPRLSSGRVREIARESFLSWDRYNLFPREDMGELIRELKRGGAGIYLLSNVSRRFAERAGEYIPAAECFDGMVFSAVEHLLKPQREIYERLLTRYGLPAKECFFIDDAEANVRGAEALGIRGYCFADGDIGKLRSRLSEVLGEPASDPVSDRKGRSGK